MNIHCLHLFTPLFLSNSSVILIPAPMSHIKLICILYNLLIHSPGSPPQQLILWFLLPLLKYSCSSGVCPLSSSLFIFIYWSLPIASISTPWLDDSQIYLSNLDLPSDISFPMVSNTDIYTSMFQWQQGYISSEYKEVMLVSVFSQQRGEKSSKYLCTEIYHSDHGGCPTFYFP